MVSLFTIAKAAARAPVAVDLFCLGRETNEHEDVEHG
jgi:hypothetical protein